MLKPVTNASPPAEKIALFRSLFRGREDVYPQRFESRKTGRAGYSPACGNEWVRGVCEKPRIKCSDCPHQAWVPVGDEVVRAHLSGADERGVPFVMGVYPMLRDERCWFLAVDFDGDGWRDDALAYLETCERSGVAASLERSRSGNGGHVWIFFAEALPATLARKLGAAMLTETMERRPEIGLKSYDRFFQIRTRCRAAASATSSRYRCKKRRVSVERWPRPDIGILRCFGAKILHRLENPVHYAELMKANAIFVLCFAFFLLCSDCTLHANDSVAKEAKEQFEKFITTNVPTRTDFTLIVDGRPDNSGTVTRYELLHPRYQILAENLDAQRAELTTAEKLNGDLAEIQWRGAAIVRADAYRILEVIKSKSNKTISLFGERKVDKSWREVGRNLPLVGHFTLTKTKSGWSITRWREGDDGRALTKETAGKIELGSTGNAAWLDTAKTPEAKLYVNDGSHKQGPAQLLALVASGELTSKPIVGDTRITPPVPPAVDAGKQLEALSHTRTAETMVFVFEQRESNVRLSGPDENPYFLQQKTTEFHTPQFETTAIPTSVADQLNGITARAEVVLRYEAMRVTNVQPPPQPTSKLIGMDEKWGSKGTEHFVARFQNGTWIFTPYYARARDTEELAFRVVPKPS